MLDDIEGLTHAQKLTGWRNAQFVEPGATRQTEERTTIRDEIEHRDLSGNLDWMQRVGVQRGGTKADARGRLRSNRQRDNWRLEEQVSVDRERVEAEVL